MIYHENNWQIGTENNFELPPYFYALHSEPGLHN